MTSESSNQEPDSLSDEEKSRRFSKSPFLGKWTFYDELLKFFYIFIPLNQIVVISRIDIAVSCHNHLVIK